MFCWCCPAGFRERSDRPGVVRKPCCDSVRNSACCVLRVEESRNLCGSMGLASRSSEDSAVKAGLGSVCPQLRPKESARRRSATR
jgi:hypothetical protein